MVAQSHGKESSTLSDLLQVLRQRKSLVLLLLSLVLLSTLVLTALAPRWYLSTAKIRVEKPEGEVKLFQSQGGGAYDPFFQQDQFRILQSEKILYPVIESLHLGARFAAEEGSDTALPPALAYRYLSEKMLRPEAQRSSTIIDINVYARDPALAAEIANEIARVYSEDRIALATSEQRAGLAKLRGELESQERVVSAQRDGVEKLRKDLGISGVDLNARHSDMEVETLRQMQNSLIALRVDAIGRKTRWERFRAIPASERFGLVNAELVQDPNIQNLLQAYLVSDQNVTRLKARLGEAHPELVAAVDSRSRIREQLDAQLDGYEKSLEISYREAEARVSELEAQLARAKVDQILSARERLRPFEEAVQRMEDETRLLTTLKLTLRQREIDFQVPKKTIELLNVAEPARQPSRPNWLLNLTAALFFGLLLGVGTAVFFEHFDTSLRNVADLEGRLQLPVVAVIPHYQGLEDRLACEEDPEPYRVLLANLNRSGQAGCRILMLCSAGPGEGKSSTLASLARVAAAAGERVLLVDADLRRPVQHRLAGCERSPGLGEYLKSVGEVSVAGLVRPSGHARLDLITSGTLEDPAFGHKDLPRLKELLTGLRASYDWILVDAPPVVGVSDTSLLTGAVDGVLLLVQHRRNPQSMVLRAKTILASLGTPLLGAVLNQVPSGGGEDYSYYTQNYDYYGHPERGSASGKSSGKRTSRSKAKGSEKMELREKPRGGEKD
jgi:capsular exopolysaccharide synthesis family protein